MRNPNRAVGLAFVVLIALGAVWWARQEGRTAGDGDRNGVASSNRTAPDATRPAPASAATPRALAVAPAARPQDAIAQFQGWADRYLAAPATERPALAPEGRALAEARRDAYLKLMRDDPAKAVRDALPYAVRRQMPADFDPLLEKRISGSGNLLVLGVAPTSPDASVNDPIRRMVELDGTRYTAFVYGRRTFETTQFGIPINGVALNKTMAVSDQPARLLEQAEVQDLGAAGKLPADPVCSISGLSANVNGAPLFMDLAGRAFPLCSAGHADLLNQRFLEGMQRLLLPADSPDGTNLVGRALDRRLRVTQGRLNVLLMRLAFVDDPREPITLDAAYNLLNTVNEYYVASSYNTVQMIPTVTPLLILPKPESYYGIEGGPMELLDDARAVARRAGYDYIDYDLDIVGHQTIPGDLFAWGGLGFVGFRGAWIQSFDPMVVTHELGHNFGLLHANASATKYATPVPTIDQTVKTIDVDSLYGHDSVLSHTYGDDAKAASRLDKEYGNPNDWMGSGAGGSAGQFSSLMKWWLHWLSPAHVGTPVSGTTNRIYAFDGPSLAADRLYALAFDKDRNFTNSNHRTYWLDHRQLFPGNAWIANGLNVYWTPWEGTKGSAQLLDMTPGSSGGVNDAALVVGHSFDDTEADIHITPVAKGGASPEEWVDVVVTFGPFPGNHAPTFNLTASSTIANPGDPILFTAANVVDPDGDPVVYRWDFSDGSFGPNASTVIRSFNTNGEFVARCEISDMKGGKASAHLLVSIGTNSVVHVTGTVVDQDGTPVADVRVAAIGTGSQPAFTDTQGRYIIAGLTNGGAVTNVAYKYGYETTPLTFANPAPVGDNDGGGFDHIAVALPTVSVTPVAGASEQGLRPGSFRFTRTGPTNIPLLVPFAVNGSASAGKDYKGIGSSVTFGPGTSVVDVAVTPLADTLAEGSETVTLQILIPALAERYYNVITNDGTNDMLLIGTNTWPVPGWEVNVLGQPSASITIADAGGAPTPGISLALYDEAAMETGDDDAVILVSRDSGFDSVLAVNYAISGTAQNGLDYETLPGVVNFAAGQHTAAVIIRAIDDLFVEGDETVTLTLTPGTGYTTNSGPATAIIVDNDLPTVSVDAVRTITSEMSSISPAAFIVSRSGPLDQPLQVNYLLGGTATNGIDFRSLPGSVVIPAGSDFARVEISALPDAVLEGRESVILQISSSTAYNVGRTGSATVWIADASEPLVFLQRTGTNVTAEGGAALQWTVTRVGGAPGPLTVFYKVDGTADYNSDFTSVGNSVFLPKGITNATVTLAPVDDSFPEVQEVVNLTLVAGDGYILGDAVNDQGFINDNDGGSAPLVEFSTTESRVYEGRGSDPWLIPVRISAAAPHPIAPLIVEYEVRAATAAMPSNYILTAWPLLTRGWLSFDYTPSNSEHFVLETNIAVTVFDNTNREPDKYVLLALKYPNLIVTNTSQKTNDPVPPATVGEVVTITNYVATPTNYAIGPRQFHRLVIQDDDAGTVGIDVSKPNAYEEGRTPGQFVLTRSGPLDQTLSVQLALSGTASPGLDYLPPPSVVTFPVGSNTVYLDIYPLDDQTPEPTETITVTLSDVPGGAIDPNHVRAQLSLIDNDGTMEFTALRYTVTEPAGHIDIPVRRTGDASHSQSVAYALVPGTATPGLDYNANDGVLIFLPGETQKTIPVDIVDDSLPEPTETVQLQLFNQSGGSPLAGQSTATLYIESDDTGFVFATNTFVVAESSATAQVVVQRVGNTNALAHVHVLGTNGTATADADYTSVDTVLAFPPGVTNATVSVKILDDVLVEGDETVILTLDPVAGEGAVDPTPATLVIRDDDCTLDFALADVRVYENAGTALLTVRRLGGVINPVSVSYRTTNGTALAGTDYTAVSGTLTLLGDRTAALTNGSGTIVLLPGEDQAVVRVPILDDNIGEPSKTFSVVLSNPKSLANTKLPGAVSLGTNATTTVTILDDELPGNEDSQYANQVSVADSVNAIGIQPSGRVVFGGDFTEVNDFTLRHVARLTLQGDLDTGFNPGIGADGTVLAILAQPDGRVVLGGTFSRVASQSRAGLARLNTDGEIDLTFQPGQGANAAVRAIAIEEGGSILAGGDFTRFDGVTRSRLVRVDATGAQDLDFTPVVQGSVNALAVQADGRILVGGAFTNVNAVKTPGLVRLSSDGTIDKSFSTGSGFVGPVLAIAVQPDGRIVVGGGFTKFNGLAVGPLVRLNADGTLDPTFVPGAGPNGLVRAVAVHGSGRIYIGGDFTQIDGNPAGHFARLRPDGGLDPAFQTGDGADARVRALALQDNSAVLIGGDFATVNKNPAARIARIHGDEKLTLAGVEFVSALTTVDEGVGQVTLTVRRTGDPSVAFTAHYTTVPQGSTATAGQDYVAASGTLTFGAGVTAQSFKLTIIDDSVVEATESVVVKIDAASDGVDLGGLVTSIVQITDNEVSVGFAAASYTVAEGDTNAEVTLVRQGKITGPISVQIATADGTATAGQDYTAVTTTVNFTGSETTRKVQIPILDDTVREPVETFTATLSAPSGGVQLSLATTTISITDNDADKLVFVASALVSDANNNGVTDPAETVTLSVALRNAGSADATNVVATLLAANNIVPSGGPQTYGFLPGNGAPVSRSFTFSNSGSSGTTLNLVLQLQDGGRSLGTVQVPLAIGEQSLSYRSDAPVVINDHGTASPYPSTVLVNGVSGIPTRFTVTLDGFSHTSPSDVDMLLVAPDGEKSVILSDVGGTVPATDLVITLSDAAATVLPAGGGLTSGVFRPVNYVNNDAFDPPAPAGPYPRSDLQFTMQDPNGTWSLYILDDTTGDSGVLQNGWKLNIFTSGRIASVTDVGVLVTPSSDPVILGQNLTYTVRVVNNGPGAATAVALRQVIPAGVTFVSATGGATFSAGVLSATIPSLQVGAAVEFVVVVKPTAVGTVATTATVSANEKDVYGPNDSTSLTTAVNAPVVAVPLAITRGENTVTLSWPLNGAGVLEFSPDLSPNSWTPVAATPVRSESVWTVTLSATSGVRFYRLRTP
jgi:uncharacterized repeat protein (TIGR01451 family)/uncharacterized delta-60 repeat protein